MSDDIHSIAEHSAPKSDQINADDLISGPRTVTVVRVVRGPAESPVEIVLSEMKPYRPCKSMRRLLIAVWGDDPRTWPQPARMTIYRDPDVVYGGVKVGGIRISHVSGIKSPVSVMLTAKRGSRLAHTVQPLVDPASLDDVLASHGLTMDDCDRWLAIRDAAPASTATPQRQASILARLKVSHFSEMKKMREEVKQ